MVSAMNVRSFGQFYGWMLPQVISEDHIHGQVLLIVCVEHLKDMMMAKRMRHKGAVYFIFYIPSTQ